MLAARASHVETVPIDWWVLAFNTMLAAATGVLSGLASLMAIRSNGFAGATHRLGRSVTGRTWLRQGLLAVEVAVVFVLVLTAALLSQTLWNLHHSQARLRRRSTPDRRGNARDVRHDSRTADPNIDVLRPSDRADRPRAGCGVGRCRFHGAFHRSDDGDDGSVRRRPATGQRKGASVSVAVVTPGYFTTMRMQTAGRP